MRVLRYTLRRLLFVVPVLAAALFLTFALTRMVPGNPIDRVAGPYISNEQRAALKHQAYLDRPFYTQFALYVRDIVHGKLGVSYTTAQDVSKDLHQRFPASFELVTYAMLIAVLIAVPPVAAARAEAAWLESRPDAIGEETEAPFELALRRQAAWLIGQLALWRWRAGLLEEPPPGAADPYAAQIRGEWAQAAQLWTEIGCPYEAALALADAEDDTTLRRSLDTLLKGNFSGFWAVVKALVLPGLTLGFVAMAPIARFTRATMAEVLESDYIRTARSLGLPFRVVVLRLGLKNALIPILTIIAAVYGYALGGEVLVEIIYNWPGLGLYSYNAILSSDFPAIQGFVLLVTALYMAIYLLLDLATAALDPRVKF